MNAALLYHIRFQRAGNEPEQRYVVAGSLNSAIAVLRFNDAELLSVQLLGLPVYADEAPPPGGRQITTDEIKATFTEDGQFLISLENGKKYRSLKGHLKKFGLTMEQYRAKWGLPDTYPANSVAYSMRRAELAKSSGLGRKK